MSEEYVLQYTNNTYSNNVNIETVDLGNLSWKDNSMEQAFYNCTNLKEVSNINNDVIDMSGAFHYCDKLVDVSLLPNNVIDMSGIFSHCYNLVSAPKIPNKVTNMSWAFDHCINLIDSPSISNSVINMVYTFYNCTNLVNAPVLPNSVTNMHSTFFGCTNLVNALVIPITVTDMYATFSGCSNLTNAPVIPNSVTDMYGTFYNCSNLIGDIYIHSENIINGGSCFARTDSNKEKDVYIPFKNNGVNTATYNSFINAGYSTSERVHGVLLKNINGEDIDLSDYEYIVNGTDSEKDIELTKYIGTGKTNIITPHLS